MAAIMEYTIRERVTITAWIITAEVSVEENRQRFRDDFKKDPPPRQTLVDWKNKLLETGSLVKRQPGQGRRRTVTGELNTQRVLQAIENDNTTSIRRLSDELDVPQTSIHRILKKSHLHPYKPLYSQELFDGDDDRRLQFCEIMNDRFLHDPAFLRKLSFSDECVIHLTGSINKHNIHYWSNENPRVRIKNPGQTPAVTVWVCVSFYGIVARDISCQTMNSERYCDILRDKVIPHFKRHNQMLYQQDGASSHYSLNARQLLDDNLPGRWIGRRGPVEWPARSPDLTVCDVWFWSYLRDRVFQPRGIKFQSIRELEDRVLQEMDAIPQAMFRDSFRDFQKRTQRCADVGGGYFEM